MFNILSLPSKLLNVFYVIAALVIVYLIYSTVVKFIGPNQDSNVRGQQEVVISTIEGNTEALKKVIDTQKKANDISNDIVNDVVTQQKNNSSSKDNKHHKNEKKVTDIKKDFDDKISQTTDPELTVKLIKEKEIEVSRVRITALWSNFCKNETQEPECKDIVL